MKPEEQWKCIGGCGACCRLDPALRAEALEALNPQQQQTYLAMVGADGWCIHFDTGARRCRIYEQRPDFCRVANLVGLFLSGGCTSPEEPDSAVNPAFPPPFPAGDGNDALPCDEGHSAQPAANQRLQHHGPQDEGAPEPSQLVAGQLDDLAIACCRQQIRSEWGGRGKVMRRFNRAVRQNP